MKICTLFVLLQLGLTLKKQKGRLREEPLTSTPTDILSPFSEDARFPRSTTTTNTTKNFTHFYETHSPNEDEWAHVQTLQFIDATTDPKRSALGTVTFVDHPRTTFSVLEPFQAGSCNGFWPVRATVLTTATRRSGGCVMAQNAGFFRMTTSSCLGNIVSEGKFVRESDNVVNANFGIKASGNIFVGYLSNEEAKNKSDPFIQLLSGIIWLVKNGTNFVNESMRIESDHNEDTGNMSEFVNVISARTAVGHDRKGRVMMVVVDGQTRKRGVNLFELADIMIRQGAVNAINLDGGGSATLVRDGVLGNHVSDHCIGNPEYRCMRQVSTVICAHEESCVPQDCNQHGDCEEGECRCSSPWTGFGCGELVCGNNTCGGHGSCETGVCVCDDGWIGELCENPCPTHFYGHNCNTMCWCSARGLCHPVTGACLCDPGYEGNSCENECLEGKYGDNCTGVCGCIGNASCHHVVGCVCNDGWQGEECNISTIQSIPSTGTPISSVTVLTNPTVSTGTLPTNSTSYPTESGPALATGNITRNISTEIHTPDYTTYLLGFNFSADCYKPLLFSSLPLVICSGVSNALICLASWMYWGGYKRRMLRRRGNYSDNRQLKMKDIPTSRKVKPKETSILKKIIKPHPPSYELVSTQIVNESSGESSS